MFVSLINPLRGRLLHAQPVSSQNLPEDDADEEVEMFAQECRDIRAAMPPHEQRVLLQVPDNVSKPLGKGTLGIDSLNLDTLIDM